MNLLKTLYFASTAMRDMTPHLAPIKIRNLYILLLIEEPMAFIIKLLFWTFAAIAALIVAALIIAALAFVLFVVAPVLLLLFIFFAVLSLLYKGEACEYSKKCPDFNKDSIVCTKEAGMYYGWDGPASCWCRMKKQELDDKKKNKLERRKGKR